MIIQIGTDADESRILWKHKESDDWQGADIDDLIDVYEDILTGELISRAEVVEVVRCKDCKYYQKSEMYSYCSIINVKGRSPKQINFCSYGERKGGDDE
jgi:hypothetical protein